MKHLKDNNDLQNIPGVGKSIAKDLRNIGIYSVGDLIGKNPEKLFEMTNIFEGKVQDRCLLYVYRQAVYFAENKHHDLKKLKWWDFKD